MQRRRDENTDPTGVSAISSGNVTNQPARPGGIGAPGVVYIVITY